MNLNAEQTAAALPYLPLAKAIRDLLLDASVKVPPRLVQPLFSGGILFVMPASDKQLAITKLITFVANNPARQLPAIQGDVVVFDAINGQRLCMLDGPTVTARRTAAVSLLAAQLLAPKPNGKLLIVGAGVQGRSHLEAFAQGLGVKEVRVASRSRASAEALVQHAINLGLQAKVADNADEALAECSLVVTATSAQNITALRAGGVRGGEA
jgi:ornithine cyclodeaminase